MALGNEGGASAPKQGYPNKPPQPISIITRVAILRLYLPPDSPKQSLWLKVQRGEHAPPPLIRPTLLDADTGCGITLNIVFMVGNSKPPPIIPHPSPIGLDYCC